MKRLAALVLVLAVVVLSGCGGNAVGAYAKAAGTARTSADEIVDAYNAARNAGEPVDTVPAQVTRAAQGIYDVGGSPPATAACQAFDANVMRLEDPNSEAQQLLNALWAESGTDPDAISAIKFACHLQGYM